LENQHGTADLTINAESNGQNISDTFSITVNAVDDPPTIATPISDVTVNEDDANKTIDLANVFLDVDDTQLSKTILRNSNPTLISASIADDTLTIEFLENQHGTADLTIKAESNGQSISDTFTIVVLSDNDRPVITKVQAQSIIEAHSLTITSDMIQATDIEDNDALIIAIKQFTNHGTLFVNGAPVNAQNPDFQLSMLTGGTVKYSHDGGEDIEDSFTFVVRDNDNGESESKDFVITIQPTNDPPTLSEPSDITVTEASSITMTDAILQASDEESSDDQLTYQLQTIPKHGSIQSNGVMLTVQSLFTQKNINDAEIVFVHNGDESNADDFSFTLSDADGKSIGPFHLNIHIVPVNDPPTIESNMGITVNEEASKIITSSQLYVWDPDTPSNLIVFQLTRLPDNGTLYIVNTPFSEVEQTFTQEDIDNNRIHYKHDGSETTEDSFRFKVMDDSSNNPLESTRFEITIIEVNDPPVADSFLNEITDEDNILSRQLSFDDPENFDCTYHLISLPSKGSVTINENGVFIYSPDENETGDDSFTYQVKDQDKTSNTATVNIHINAVNDPPQIVNNGITLSEDETVSITTSHLSAIDPDNNNNEIQFQIQKRPENGILYRNTTPLNQNQIFTLDDIQSGAIHYQHDDSETESDTFTFNVTDGSYTGTIQTFYFVIMPVNDPPVADNFENESTDEDNIHEGKLTFYDSEDDTCTFHQASVPSKGTVVIDEISGIYTYTPNENEYGEDSFTYQVKDETLFSNTATVTIHINPVNDPPQIVNNVITLLEGHGITITTEYLSASDVDNPNHEIIFQIEQRPSNGTLFIGDVPFIFDQKFTMNDMLSNSIRYQHDDSETKSDSFIFNVTDGKSLSESQTFSLVVTPVNDKPTVSDISGTIKEDEVFIDVLTFNDPENLTCTYSIHSQPSNGSIQFDGYTFTYHPNINFYGTDVFKYQIHDNGGKISDPGTVTINVISVNDPPEIADIPANIRLNEGDMLTISSDILSASDPDNTFHFQFSQLPHHGTITKNGNMLTLDDTFSLSDIADSIIVYTHDGFESKSDSFIVTVKDADGLADSAAITLTIINVNDSPVAGAIDNIQIDEDNIHEGQLSYSDPEGNTCTYHKATAPSNGTIIIDEITGAFIYTPKLNYNGKDSFTYFVKDSENSQSETATVSFQIRPINDLPVIQDMDNIYLEMNASSEVISYSVSDIETPDEFLIIQIQPTDPNLIEITNNDTNNHTFVIKPKQDKTGTARVLLSITDENNETAKTSFSVNVTYKDTIPPELTLNGDSLIKIEKGTTFEDPGATATDNGLTFEAIPDYSNFNNDQPGVYQIKYTFTDIAGNAAIPIYRTVNVYEIPSITVTGNVVTEDDEPLANVTVTEKTSALTVVTNVEGVFTYSGLKKTGEMYYLIFNREGYEPVTKKFSGFSPYDNQSLQDIEMLSSENEDIYKFIGVCKDARTKLPIKDVQIDLSAPGLEGPITETTHSNETGQYTIAIDIDSILLPATITLKTIKHGYKAQNWKKSTDDFVDNKSEHLPITTNFSIPKLTRLIVDMPVSKPAHELAQDNDAVTITVKASPPFSNASNEFCVAEPNILSRYNADEKAYIIRYSPYESFSITLQADTTENLRVNDGYERTRQIHFTEIPVEVSYTATEMRGLTVTEGQSVIIKSKDTTSKTLLEIPVEEGFDPEQIPDTIDFTIQEYDDYSLVEGKIVSVDIQDDQGNKLGDTQDNPLKKIYVEMEYPSTVTREELFDGSYHILHATSAAEIFEGVNVPIVPVSQIEKEETTDEKVRFWVRKLSAFAIQKAVVPETPPSRELPHPPSNCFIQSASQTAYSIGWLLSLLIIGGLTGVFMTRLLIRSKQMIPMIIALIFCMAIVFPHHTVAQMQTGKVMFSLMPGGMVFEKNKNIGDGPVFGLGLGYSFTPCLDAEFMALYGQHNVSFWDETQQSADYEKSGSLTYNINIQYHLTASKIFIPYLGLGIGSMNFDSDAIDDNNAVRINYGLGAKYFLDEIIALRGDIYHIFSLDDPDNQFACTLGLTFQLGAEPSPKAKPVIGPDKDGDGITDSKDECPDTPANLVVNRVGCPKDSDMDGVYDNMDECPSTPDHVIVDRAGCPKDTDMDGVYDHLDQCPDTPKMLDVNPMGCPPDKDKDAVPDYKDTCPNTPANTPVDTNGCSTDHDNDGVLDSQDNCPNTPKNTRVDKKGCPVILDLDNDGIPDSKDRCPDTKPGVRVNNNGCQLVVKKQICMPYAIQVSSYQTRQKAHQIAMKYRKKGDPLFVSMRKSDDKSVFGIFYGVYRTQLEAEKTVIVLKQRKFKNVILMNLPYAIHVEPNEMFIDNATVQKQLIKRGFSPYEVRDNDILAMKYYVGAYVNASDAESIVKSLIVDGFKATIEKRCIEIIKPVQPDVSVLEPEPDQDQDGVPDLKDRCPDTLKGAKTDAHGCQILENESVQVPYAVQVSSYPTRKQAHAVAMKYKNKGEPLFASMIQSSDPKVYSIFYGVYESTSEADSVAHKLKLRHFKDVMRLKLPYAILVQPNTVYVDIDIVKKRLIEKGFIAYKLTGSNEIKYYVGAYPNAQLAQKEADILISEGFDARVEKRGITRNPQKPKDLPYVLLISAYSEQKKAFEVAKHFRNKNDPTFNSYTDVPDTDKDHEIYYGYYQSAQDTGSVIETLKKRNFRQFDLKKKPYAICVGIVDQQHDLAKLESQLAKKGYLSYAIPVYDRPDLQKVYVGAFKTKSEAKACYEKMKADGFLPTIVLRSDKRSDPGKLSQKPAVIDSDQDGIPDNIDKCANTPRNTSVMPDGCPKPLKPQHSVLVKDRNEYPYTIQINAYPNKAKAMEIIRKFRKKGDPMYMSYIKMEESKDSYGVFYGCYQTFDDVKKVAAQLKARLFRRVDILNMPYSVQLGIFSKTENMERFETSLYKKGYASFRLFNQTGERNIQILIGAYKTKKGAQQFKKLLISEGFHSKIVKRIGAPAAQPEIPLITVLQDKDKDGILDEVDQCPGTKSGDIVNQDGCSIAQISEQDYDTKPLFTPLVSSSKSSDTDDFYPYTIRVSSYKDREAANQIAIKFRQKGDSMFISYGQTKDGTPVHDVFFGFYRNFEESQMAALALERRHFKNIEMIKMPYAIQMGVFDSYTALVKKENELISKGYLTYSVPDRIDNSNIRLLIGAYPTEKAAERFVEELKSNGFSPFIVKR
jgi:VCBS repeat-containing protein